MNKIKNFAWYMYIVHSKCDPKSYAQYHDMIVVWNLLPRVDTNSPHFSPLSNSRMMCRSNVSDSVSMISPGNLISLIIMSRYTYENRSIHYCVRQLRDRFDGGHKVIHTNSRHANNHPEIIMDYINTINTTVTSDLLLKLIREMSNMNKRITNWVSNHG